ncbi:MAG TPA: hypothetical protein VIV15_08020 [Anaerolineales bacterium]
MYALLALGIPLAQKTDPGQQASRQVQQVARPDLHRDLERRWGDKGGCRVGDHESDGDYQYTGDKDRPGRERVQFVEDAPAEAQQEQAGREMTRQAQELQDIANLRRGFGDQQHVDPVGDAPRKAKSRQPGQFHF